ncbi:hypothetical protein [Streptomyces sp. NPDC101132]|uniref:hypothetical protein n=1 Tax=Streptomyces sp. NPDC101132 TaxID=3366110 RepID=UPI00382222C0
MSDAAEPGTGTPAADPATHLTTHPTAQPTSSPTPTPGPAPTEASDADGRALAPVVALLATTVAVTSSLTGLLLTAGALAGRVAGPWTSPSPVGPGLVGAAMLGTAPGLLALARARRWEEARTLVFPLVTVLVGLFAVAVLNAGQLQAAEGGPLFLALFSLGWVAVLGLLALAAVLCLARQYTRPATPLRGPVVPPPAWSRPLLAVLGSSWLGTGAGLLFLPGFWAEFVPWEVNRTDAQSLGVWALALGIGVLGTLAEDDLRRVRPALISVPGVALAAGAVLAVRAGDVDWTSGGAVSLAVLLLGLLTSGLTGHRLAARAGRTPPARAGRTPPARAGGAPPARS